jgi:hypothetical protein
MTPWSPWLKAAVAHLTVHGKTHKEELIAVMTPNVPYQQGWRAGERGRLRQFTKERREQGDPPRRKGTDLTTVAAGRRDIVVGALYQAVATGTIIRDGDVYRLPDA